MMENGWKKGRLKYWTFFSVRFNYNTSLLIYWEQNQIACLSLRDNNLHFNQCQRTQSTIIRTIFLGWYLVVLGREIILRINLMHIYTELISNRIILMNNCWFDSHLIIQKVQQINIIYKEDIVLIRSIIFLNLNNFFFIFFCLSHCNSDDFN